MKKVAIILIAIICIISIYLPGCSKKETYQIQSTIKPTIVSGHPDNSKYGGIQQSPPHILEFDGIDDFADFLSLSSASDEIKEQYLETLDKTKSGIANKSIFNVTIDSLSNLSYLLIDTNDISVMNVLYYLDYNYVMISYNVGKSDVVLRSISYLSEAKDDFVFSEDIFYVSGLSFKKVISDNKEYVVFMCIEKTFTISLIASAELETWCIDNLGYCFEVEKGVNLY